MDEAEGWLGEVEISQAPGHDRTQRTLHAPGIRDDGKELQQVLMGQTCANPAVESIVPERLGGTVLWGVFVVRVDQDVGVQQDFSRGPDISPPASAGP